MKSSLSLPALATIFAVAVQACTPALENDTVIWPSDGKIPASLSKQYVFLSEDRHTAIIRFPPNQDGSPNQEILRIPIHNKFQAHVGTLIKQEDEGFSYQYRVVNSRKSEDVITSFTVVVTPDETLRYGAFYRTEADPPQPRPED
jgi:hypothetical protein